MKKLLFFLGKGGVGKTTMAAAASSSLAALDFKVLIASLDPAHNLGDVFGVRLDGRRRPLQPGLDAMEVDLPYWIDRCLEQSREEIRANYAYNLGLNLDSFLKILKLAPGSEEYAMLWAIEHLHSVYGEEYDTIIFDTPPTALTLRFLAMPALSTAWVRELAAMREHILSKRQTLLKINPEAGVPRGAVSREGDRVYGKLTSIRERLQRLHRLFSRDSYLTVGVNPDSLSLAESLRIREKLERLEIQLNSIFLNKAGADGEHLDRLHQVFDNSCPVFPTAWQPAGIASVKDLQRLDLWALLRHYINT